MTAPVGSCMTPLMLACVWATAGTTLRKTINQIDQIHRIHRLRIVPPFWGVGISRSSLAKLLPDENNFGAGEGSTPDSSISKSDVHFTSEQQLQRKLDLPRRRRGGVNDPARGAVLGALEENLIRVREIRVIQHIEHLGPELQIQSLTDSHPL